MVELGNSVGNGMLVHRVVLEQGHEVTGLTTIIYMMDHGLAFFRSSFILVVEMCKIDQPRSNS